MNIDADNIGFVVVGLLILWAVWRTRRRARAPEARYEAAALQAARDAAVAGLPDGWVVSHPDRERFGTGADGVVVYGAVAGGPAGERVLGLALSKAAALESVVAAVQGDPDRVDAWAPPVSDLSTGTVDAPAGSDARLPIGWTLLAVDRERFSADGEPVSAFGALAVGPGGRRALAVALDRATALQRLVDRIEGRLPVTDSWSIRVDGPRAGG